jgi:hypothetical protein
MSKLKENQMYQGTQHGEIYLLPVSKVPKGNKSQHSLFIVGHSETGHHHVLESKAEFEVIEPENMSDSIFLSLLQPAQLVHKKSFDKHQTLTIKPGLYEVKHKREYNPFEKVISEVKD